MANRTLMAVGAHADDIELNVGGALAKYRAAGYEIVYVMATNNMSGVWQRRQPDGSIGRTQPPYHVIMPQRKREAAAAAEAFGTTPIHLDHPQRHYTRDDGSVVELRYGCERPGCVAPDTPTILTAHEHAASVKALAELILERRPEAVMTHGPAMVDMEHVGTCLLTTKAYRQAIEAGHDGMLLHWLDISPPIFGDTFARWDTFIDVSAYWEEKLAAIGLHACQMPDPSRLDFPEWGPACGCSRAEVFTIGGHGRCGGPHAAFRTEIFHHCCPAGSGNATH
jgi:LmbE family N-acetylglucosaminyl deacetylase